MSEKLWYITPCDEIVEAEIVDSRPEGWILYSESHGAVLMPYHHTQPSAEAARAMLMSRLYDRLVFITHRIAHYTGLLHQQQQQQQQQQ